MKRKIVWLSLSCLMALSLVMVSCAPKVTEEEEVTEEEVTEEEVPTFEEPFRVGETAQSARISVTVTEIYLTDSYEYYDDIKKEMAIKEASPGKTFLMAYVKIKRNKASKGDSREGTNMMRGGSDETSVTFSPYYGEDRLAVRQDLGPEGELYNEIEGRVLFIVPKGSTGYWVKYSFTQYPPYVWAQWLLE